MRYDEELALSTGTTEQRIEHVVSNAVAEAGEQTDVGNIAEPVHKSQEAIDDELETGLDADEPEVERNPHHPGLTERVASFGRSPIVTIGLCAFFGAFIAAAIVFVTPADTDPRRQAGSGVADHHAARTDARLRRRARHRVLPPPAGRAAGVLVPQTDLAILNWRREKSVFLGTNQPQEDASWIFQLRMAELERAKSGRTSEPRPWQRLAARIFDYAIWGLVLALLLSELRGLGLVPSELAFWLGHPLLAPMLITGIVGADRGAAHRVHRHHARQVALRRVPAILDLRCLRPARHARAARSRAYVARSACGGRASAAAFRCSRRC